MLRSGLRSVLLTAQMSLWDGVYGLASHPLRLDGDTTLCYIRCPKQFQSPTRIHPYSCCSQDVWCRASPPPLSVKSVLHPRNTPTFRYHYKSRLN